jgi:hypothetical protein
MKVTSLLLALALVAPGLLYAQGYTVTVPPATTQVVVPLAAAQGEAFAPTSLVRNASYINVLGFNWVSLNDGTNGAAANNFTQLVVTNGSVVYLRATRADASTVVVQNMTSSEVTLSPDRSVNGVRLTAQYQTLSMSDESTGSEISAINTSAVPVTLSVSYW